jgi:hypothetical protein
MVVQVYKKSNLTKAWTAAFNDQVKLPLVYPKGDLTKIVSK